jgi:hypothetical protein
VMLPLAIVVLLGFIAWPVTYALVCISDRGDRS